MNKMLRRLFCGLWLVGVPMVMAGCGEGEKPATTTPEAKTDTAPAPATPPGASPTEPAPAPAPTPAPAEPAK